MRLPPGPNPYLVTQVPTWASLGPGESCPYLVLTGTGNSGHHLGITWTSESGPHLGLHGRSDSGPHSGIMGPGYSIPRLGLNLTRDLWSHSVPQTELVTLVPPLGLTLTW